MIEQKVKPFPYRLTPLTDEQREQLVTIEQQCAAALGPFVEAVVSPPTRPVREAMFGKRLIDLGVLPRDFPITGATLTLKPAEPLTLVVTVLVTEDMATKISQALAETVAFQEGSREPVGS